MRCNRIDFSDRFDLCAAIESTFWIAILKRLAYHKILHVRMSVSEIIM